VEASNLELLFLVVNNSLQKQLGSVFSILTMIYILEVNQESVPPQVHKKIYEKIMQAYSLLKNRPFLTKYVLQLYCLWAHLQSE
jgi:hypothetical protein